MNDTGPSANNPTGPAFCSACDRPQLLADLEQSEAQVRMELSMSMEYRAERQNAYALIAKLRPDEQFTFHVRQLLDIDGRGLRDPSETVAAVWALLKLRDEAYAVATAALSTKNNPQESR